MGRADSVPSPALTLSRRRLAFIGVAAAVALAAGFLAAKLAGPGRGAASVGANPTRTIPASPAAVAPSSSTPATTPAPASPAATTAAPVAPSGAASAPTSAPPSAATAVRPTSLPTVTVRIPRAGFSLAYPRTWTRLASHDATVPLLLSSRDGVSVLVRGAQLRVPIDGPRLAALRDLTGQVIRRHQGVSIIAGPRLLAIHNLPGFLYLYSFYDRLSRQRVAHSHIVLFNGRRMYTLVFQTARASDLPRFAMLFDKISASFRPI